MKRRSLSRAFVLALAALAIDATAVDIELRNAWARPMAKGYAVARVYVDIRSDTTLRLVGATSPAAASVALVAAGAGPGEKPREVSAMDIAADRETRLALNGDYLELRDVLEDKRTGSTIPFRLEFVDAAGKRYAAETAAVVRGISLQPPPEPAMRLQPVNESPKPSPRTAAAGAG